MLVLLVILVLLGCWLLSEAEEVDRVAVLVLLDLIAGSALVVPVVSCMGVSVQHDPYVQRQHQQHEQKQWAGIAIRPPPIDPFLRMDPPDPMLGLVVVVGGCWAVFVAGLILCATRSALAEVELGTRICVRR